MPPEAIPPFNPLDLVQRNERLHHFSHALKNRLGGLWQAAAMLHDLPEGPERRQLLELAERNFFNGAAELEQLMDDFAVPRGISKVQCAPVDVVGLLRECISDINYRLERKQQQVILEGPATATLGGDRQVLRQLFEALLSNASKFSPKGSPVHVALSADEHAVSVAVTDRGVGLSPEDLEKVFVRYAMLGSHATDGESQARSTLARAKQWAEAHGGSLHAASAGGGKGSTFTVHLPVRR
ncbi:MAG: HAMP domain-containing histidine kinase [Bacteroidetes bacterium]|nr:HAMP domain-containing histidine kinase [Bacteroidota bacterium]